MQTTVDYSLLKDPDMKEIFYSFIVETKELLEKLDLDLIELEQRPEDMDLLNEIFRSFHTIKGTSGFLGLVKLQKGEASVNEEIMNGILQGYDSIKALLSVIEDQKNENVDTEAIISTLQGIIDDLETSAGKPKQEKKESKKAGAKQETKEAPQLSDQIEPDPKSEEKKSVKEVKENHEPAAQKSLDEKRQSLIKKGENTIRVDVERLDDLLNFVQELVLGRNRLAQLNIEMMMEHEGTELSRNLGEATRQIDLMTTELQLAVMKTRMIKIGKVFNRFPRLVRDLSRETGKDIQLVIKGEETELDKTLIEEINDPLVHLVRNSIDHGIEPPDERVKCGKDGKGNITLSAEHEGNNIIITISDDGKGIDPEKIKSKAIEKGLISKEKAGEMSKQEVFNLIFSPGFSTAEKVTNVSGRGVGMDVVKTNVTKLRGIINIESEVGKGSKIIIKLPLTLAIIQGLLVEINHETIVIPLNSVIEVVRVSKKQIYVVNQTQCIKLRDTVHPLIDIGNILYCSKSNGKDKEWQYVVIVGIAEKRFGIKVDKLIGQKEVVIKSLGNYLGSVEGIAGSTIMGDGKVVMIADIAELVNKIMVTN